LSKSISGYGLPMSLVLIRPELDVWQPGEHTGTFRGNNLAFIAAASALSYWQDDSFSAQIKEKADHMDRALQDMVSSLGLKADIRGRGLIQAVEVACEGLAEQVSKAAFEQGLIIETCGPRDETLKFLPPLTITKDELSHGIQILAEAFRRCLKQTGMETHS